MINTKEILEPETTYHLYNRANGWERVFLSAENYRFFLQKYQQYITPIADTFCYCLMPNHFHFLIRIKSEKELESYFKFEKASGGRKKTLEGFARCEALSKLLSQQFSHFFNGYTQAFNKQQSRKGSLMMHPFKRKRINDKVYFHNVVHYIHFNPVESNLCVDPAGWKYSSYRAIISDEPTFIVRKELIDSFDNIENFLFMHTLPPKKNDIEF